MKKLILGAAAIALTACLTSSTASAAPRGHWFRYHHHHHHHVSWHAGWRRLAHAPVRYVVSPVAYVDNPYYYWSPYSVVNNVLVHRSIEIGPIPRVYIAR